MGACRSPRSMVFPYHSYHEPSKHSFGRLLDAGGLWDSSLFAGRPFHFHYESLSLQMLFIVDLPSELAAIVPAIVLHPVLTAFHLGHYVGSYLGAAIELLVSSCQWLIIGGLVKPRLEPRVASSANS
jgi:hypothetical protein